MKTIRQKITRLMTLDRHTAKFLSEMAPTPQSQSKQRKRPHRNLFLRQPNRACR